MTRTTLLFHTVLCVAALGFAWQSAHTAKAKKGGPSAVVLLDAEKGDVESLTYTWDKGVTRTVVGGTAKSRSAVVDVDREVPPKKEPPKKPATKDEPAEAPVEPAAEKAAEREQASVPAGKNVMTAIEALEPLKTKRTLGVVDDARLEAMGLKTPLRTLEVKTRAGKTLTLELGEQSYGAQGRYARVKGDATVHLVDAAIATGLEGGPDQLLEKRLITADLETIGGFQLKAGEKTGAWVHVDKDQPSRRYFGKRDDPASKEDAAGKLMTTLRNLRGTRLASAEATQKAGNAVAAFSVDVAGTPVVIQLLERGDTGAPDGAMLARVGRWLYELTATQTKELLDDVDAIAG